MTELVEELHSYLLGAQRHLSETQAEIEGSEVWLRTSSAADSVIGAHLIRVFSSCGTTLDLCTKGNHSDAATIARVVVEHMVSLTYLARQPDVVQASEAFATKGFSHLVERHASLAKHFPELFKKSPERENRLRSLADNVEYAGKFFQQIAYLNARWPAEEYSFIRDILYSDFSIYAHPRPAGLETIRPNTRRPFRFTVRSDVIACSVSACSAIMCTTMTAVVGCQIWGLTHEGAIFERAVRLNEQHPHVGNGVFLGDSRLPDLH